MRAIASIAFLTSLTLGVTPAFAAEPGEPGLGEPVSADDLDAQRGGDETRVSNIIRISGEVASNSAQDVITGANHIQDGSFTDASGITSVVQNTGANVLIQSATILNVQFAEPGS